MRTVEDYKLDLDRMGVKYPTSASLKTLQELFKSHMTVTQENEQLEVGEIEKNRAEANKLVKCHVHCNDPSCKDLQGEVIQIGNSQLGITKTFVPYNVEYDHVMLTEMVVSALKRKTFGKVMKNSTQLQGEGAMQRVIRSPKFSVTIID